MNKLIKIIGISLLVVSLMSFAYPALAQDRGTSSSACRHGNTYCEYPGQCHDYIDSNSDGYCDRSIPSTGNANTVSPATVDAGDGSNGKVINAQAATPAAAQVPGADMPSTGDSSGGVGAQNNQPGTASGYNLLLIFIIVGLVYALSYILSSKKVITAIFHRKIWNVVLLNSAAAMLLLGLLLTLRQDYGLNIQMPFDMTFWHVEMGIIMGIITVFHVCWHWRYFAGLFKTVN